MSFIIHNDLVIFIDAFGDINALDINSGNLVWQTQTVNEDTFESSFLLKSSRLVSDEETIYVSNNQNTNPDSNKPQKFERRTHFEFT